MPSTSVAAEEIGRWELDTALLYWGESDGRVKDLSVTAAVRRALDEDRSFSLNLTVDTLTGASPSGAVPSDGVQTFTRPSGKAEYQIAAGEQPLDDTFKDTRVAVAGSWRQALGETMRWSAGGSFSHEFDYQHIGLDARLERDFNQRNTTGFFGLAYGKEDISPVGGTPVGLSPMRAVNDNRDKLGNESKDVIDALLGVTQILSRRALLEVVYSYSKADGYLSDPYKLISVVNPVTGAPVPGPVGSARNLLLFEQRPDSRTKQSLFAEYRYALDRDSMAVNYRVMKDDWGILSHTLDARYRWNRSSRDYLEPHVRYYRQDAADFYRTVLFSNTAVPTQVSADYRLAEGDAMTVGVKYGRRTQSGKELSVRLEYYNQAANPSPGATVGALAGQDLIPSLKAVIVQFGYRFNL